MEQGKTDESWQRFVQDMKQFMEEAQAGVEPERTYPGSDREPAPIKKLIAAANALEYLFQNAPVGAEFWKFLAVLQAELWYWVGNADEADVEDAYDESVRLGAKLDELTQRAQRKG